MLKPIDMQMIVQNVDHVAKVKKIDDTNIAAQHMNAEDNVKKNIELNQNTVNQTGETEQNAIGKEENKKNSSQNKEYHEKKEEKEEKKHKAKEPNKGDIVDFEA